MLCICNFKMVYFTFPHTMYRNHYIDDAYNVNGLSTDTHLRSQRTSTPYKIKVNNLIHWFGDNRGNSNNFNATIFKFSEHFDLHLCMIFYLETCFLRVAVSLLCRLQAVSTMHVPIYPYLISEGRWNCSTSW